jgi:hypothetical protein
MACELDAAQFHGMASDREARWQITGGADGHYLAVLSVRGVSNFKRSRKLPRQLKIGLAGMRKLWSKLGIT